MKDVKKAVCLVIAMILVSAMLIGCDRLSDVTGQSSNEKELAPAAQVTSAPTEVLVAAPTEAPKADPTEVPVAAPTDAPKAMPTEAPMAAPTDAPKVVEPTEASMAAPKAGGMDLPTECAPGGMLDDVATVSACNTQAMQQVKRFVLRGGV